MRVCYTIDALLHIAAIHSYINERNPVAVVGLPYVIVHELNDPEDELVVLGVYHGAQLRPGQDS